MADLSGMFAQMDAAVGQNGAPPSPPTPSVDAAPSSSPTASRGSSNYQRTMDALNAALGQGGAGTDRDPSTLTIEHGPTYGHTLAALDAVLSAPPGTRIIAGAAPIVPAGMTPRGASDPTPGSVPPSTWLRADPSSASSDADTSPQSGSTLGPTRRISDADAMSGATSAAPSPSVLANSADDGYMSGALKGAGTAAVKAVGNATGFVGGLSNLADYLMARGESAVTGQPVDEILADLARKKRDQQAGSIAGPTVARLSDPRNVLPAPADVSDPILAKTGEYRPTSEAGRLAQAGTEAALSSVGPGMGAAKAGIGTVLKGAATMAPANFVAGAAAQGATDATGSPLAGLVAGAATPAIGEAVGVGVRGVGRLAAPVAGGSKLLDAAPIVGPALQSGREAAVAGKVLGQSSDPAALRSWALSPADAPEVPNSPRTLAGSVGDDAGLYQAEKDARNVANATPTARVTVDGRGYGGQSFNGVDRAQSDAQVAALRAPQPDADVFRPGQVIRSRMDAIDAAAQDAEDRLNAAHADAVSSRTAAGQSFAADQQSGLAQRTADRVQAGADFADQARADLAGRTADRTQAAAEDAGQAQAARDDAHAQLVQRFADAHAAQLGAAQDAAAPLGEPVNAEDLGSTLRSSVEAVRAGAKGLHRDLYKAVDPEGTLALVATSVGDRASSILDGLKANGAELTPVEAPLFRRAAALPDVATYGTLHALDTDLSAAMSTERRTAGESSAWARLSQLKGSVKSAMTNAADNQAAHEARMVDAGRMAPEDTIAARLQQGFDANRSGQSVEARAAVGADHGAGPTARAAPYPGQDGAPVSSRGYAGSPSGGEGLPSNAGGAGQGAPREVGTGPRPDAPAFDPDGPLRAPQRPDMPRPQDLQAFVRAHGGMTDPGGDLRSMGLHDLIARPGRGVSQDRMRLMAAEAGYLGADTARAMAETHPNDLLDAVSGDRPVHSARDEDAAAAWTDYDAAKEAHASARGELGTRSTFGVVPERPPLDAYSRDDVEGPSGAALPAPARSGLQPNFDKGAANRLKAANAAYTEYARTYKNPIVGPGLRTTGYAGQYQRGDAAFIKGAIRPGPEGYENARAFLTAARNDPEALGAMQDAALNPLRRAALGPGFVHPKALANWKASYGPALRALDEVTPGFSSRFDDAGHATQALLDLGAEHKAAIAMARQEAARQAVIDDAARKTGLGQANAADRATVANLLAERTANDRAAAQADKTSTAAAISDRTASDRAAVAQSRADTSAGIAQARSIVREARATPAVRFANGGGTGVASTEVENAVGSFLKTGTTGATRMRGLVASVAHDTEALAGLRKAGSDWIVRSHLNADGTLSGAKLIGFLKDNAASLRELYPHDQVSMMGAIARDAEAGARWRTSTAIKGGSDTAKNLLAMAGKVGHAAAHVSLGMVAVEAVSQGFEHGGLQGAAVGGLGAAGAYLVNSLRQAGIRRTSDLYMAALADPELARALISKMPATADSGTMLAFSRALRRSLILGPMAVGQKAQIQ